VCEAFGFERGLNRPVKEAPVFYTMFAIITILSMAVVLIPGVPLFQLMILSQSMNGILLPILLVLVLILANDNRVMGKWKNKPLTNVLAIAMTVLIFVVTIALFAGELFKLG
ncbi:MAG TPA: divalent metal cation transporter, partial [Anaerolineaceae bacterium]|nr:divalent metal cation transporter [Anaerolineaceae bacterium]